MFLVIQTVDATHYNSDFIIIYSFQDFDGLWEVFLSFDDLKQTFSFHNTQDSTLYVTASVTEKLTGTTFNSTLSVEVKPSKIKVDVVYKLSTIKPGLTYTAYVSCYKNACLIL